MLLTGWSVYTPLLMQSPENQEFEFTKDESQHRGKLSGQNHGKKYCRKTNKHANCLKFACILGTLGMFHGWGRKTE